MNTEEKCGRGVGGGARISAIQTGWNEAGPLTPPLATAHFGGATLDVLNPTIAARLWAKVDKNGPIVRSGLGRCWLFTGTRDRKGYGLLRRSSPRRLVLTHRAAWMLTHGEIPDETPCVLHRCDNPPCCNPSHLFLGTSADNNADKVAKGRQRAARGDQNGMRLHPESVRRGGEQVAAKLTDDDVRVIRAVVATCPNPRQALPLLRPHFQFISAQLLRDVVLGKRWQHVALTDPPPLAVDAVQSWRALCPKCGERMQSAERPRVRTWASMHRCAA